MKSEIVDNKRSTIVIHKVLFDNEKEAPIAFLDSKFALSIKIGKGATSTVYLGTESNSPTKFAFKTSKEPSIIANEYNILSQIPSNKFIISPLSIGYNKTLYKTKTSNNKNINYIQLPYYPHGSLFDYIFYPKKSLGENFSRIILRNLLNAISSIHSANIAHLDIKCENILIDDDFNPIIVDFGFAEKDTGFLTEFRGTEGFAAPEIYTKLPFNGRSCDIFALGVVMFIVVTGEMPFRSSNRSDGFYSMLIENDYESFWRKRRVKVSENFKSLFNMMVALNPTQRPSIEEILRCKWMVEGDYSAENTKVMHTEMSRRFKLITLKKKNSKH